MAFKFNPITGQLDLVSSAATGSVGGVAPTDVNAIARWADTTGTTIQNSPGTVVQDGGGVEAQAFVASMKIDTTIQVPTDKAMIAPSLTIEPGGVIEMAPGSQLIII